MTATFRVAWTLALTGRGTAVAGTIESGVVHVGDLVVGPPHLPALPLRVKGIEAADAPPEAWVVLMFALPPVGPDPHTLQASLVPGTVLELTSPDTA